MRTLFMLLTVTFLLGACAQKPSWVPTLYKYHNDTFRSPPGKDADNIGYSYSKAANAQAVEQWHVMISDFADTVLAENTIPLSAPLYLVPHAKPTSFMNMYEHALRKALNDRGYNVVNDATAAALLFYEATPAISTPENPIFVEAGSNQRPMIFRLIAIENGRTLANTQKQYLLPLYGYEGDKSTTYPPNILEQMFTQPGAVGVVYKEASQHNE